MARYDDLNTKTIGYLTFLSAVLLAVIILLLEALCYNWIDWQEDIKLTKQSYQSSNRAIQAQQDSLHGYKKVTVEVPVEVEAAGNGAANAAPPATEMKKVERVQIPIERAKELVLEEIKAAGAKTASTPNT